MKSKKFGRLHAFNAKLRGASWETYYEVLGVFLRSTNHPSRETLLSLYEEQDFTGMVELADSLASAKLHSSALSCRVQNQLAAFIRKYPFPKGRTKFDPEGKAFETFMKAEHRCRRVNQRFRAYMTVRSPHEYALDRARSWIAYVLGPLRLRDVYDLAAFGPGASIGVHGNSTNMGRKFLNHDWTVSPGAYHYAEAALAGDPLCLELLNRREGSGFFAIDRELFHQKFAVKAKLVEHNKITFVPKTAKTLRTIAVEPLLNGFLQKGLDQVMRKRLARVGINLEDQGENQWKAWLASAWDHPSSYVTIDLSSASDSISTELCRYLLPPDWFDFMNQIRSRSYLLKGKLYPYHKFTTMGNGFCFPLETLIFASLCHVSSDGAASRSDFSVYGDDIIVRKDVAPRLLELLSVCGFTVNQDKTFLEGPFRESCGADWFNGEDVRPVTVDGPFDSLETIFNFVNTVRSKDVWEDILHPCCEYLVALIPKELMYVRPFKGNTDTALEVPMDEFMRSPFAKWDRNIQSWSWVELVHSAVADKWLQLFTGYDVAVMRGMLTGNTLPRNFSGVPIPFTIRRKTSTKVRRQAYCGACSTWLPSPDIRIHVGKVVVEQIDLIPREPEISELFDLATAL